MANGIRSNHPAGACFGAQRPCWRTPVRPLLRSKGLTIVVWGRAADGPGAAQTERSFESPAATNTAKIQRSGQRLSSDQALPADRAQRIGHGLFGAEMGVVAPAPAPPRWPRGRSPDRDRTCARPRRPAAPPPPSRTSRTSHRRRHRLRCRCQHHCPCRPRDPGVCRPAEPAGRLCPPGLSVPRRRHPPDPARPTRRGRRPPMPRSLPPTRPPCPLKPAPPCQPNALFRATWGAIGGRAATASTTMARDRGWRPSHDRDAHHGVGGIIVMASSWPH